MVVTDDEEIRRAEDLARMPLLEAVRILRSVHRDEDDLRKAAARLLLEALNPGLVSA